MHRHPDWLLLSGSGGYVRRWSCAPPDKSHMTHVSIKATCSHMTDTALSPLDPAMMEARAAEAEAFLRSLASRHRLIILCRLLEQGETSVGDLVLALGLTQSNLSRHLATLREEGLVATRREGVTIYYRIGSERVRPILTELCRLFAGPVQTTFCGSTPALPEGE